MRPVVVRAVTFCPQKEYECDVRTEVLSGIIVGKERYYFVGLVNYKHHVDKLNYAIRNRAAGFLPIDLLIDRSSVLPFLQCVDTDVDVSTFTENE